MTDHERKVYRNWWAHDGMWYQAVAKEFGFAAANRLNRQCLFQMAYRVMRNLIHQEAPDPGVLTAASIAGYYLKATDEMWPQEWVTTEINVVRPDRLDVAIHKNFALALLHRAGTVDCYECPCLDIRKGWFQALNLNFKQGITACKLKNSPSCMFWAEFKLPEEKGNEQSR